MKVLVINACEKVEQLLRLKQTDPVDYDRTVKSASFIYCRSWNR
ncbi:hypothetical protein SH668x_002233 [Planctomicrobium sp. SH668]